MTIWDESTDWTTAQTAHWQSLDTVAAWNLLLSPLADILRAAQLYTEGGYSLGAAAQAAGVHEIALMAALRLRIDSGPLSEADCSIIANTYVRARDELAGKAPSATEADQVTERQLQSVMALVREVMAPGGYRPTRAEFLDAVHRRMTTA